jgi:hypothetical protein
MVFAGDTEGEFLLSAPLKQILERATMRMAQNVNDRTLERLNADARRGRTTGRKPWQAKD